MAEQEREALARVIAGEDKPCRKALAANPGGCVGEYGWCLCRRTADAVLDWLAARDAALIAEARSEARREALYEAADELAVDSSLTDCTRRDDAYEDARDDERVDNVLWLRKKADQITPTTKDPS